MKKINQVKLHCLKACENGNENIVKYLVEHDADVNKKNEYGEIPLIRACESRNENIINYLIEHGANINKKKLSMMKWMLMKLNLMKVTLIKLTILKMKYNFFFKKKK